MTVEEAMKDIMTAILVHVNGYSIEEAQKVAADNEGSDLWCEIEETIDILISDIEDNWYSQR